MNRYADDETLKEAVNEQFYNQNENSYYTGLILHSKIKE